MPIHGHIDGHHDVVILDEHLWSWVDKITHIAGYLVYPHHLPHLRERRHKESTSALWLQHNGKELCVHSTHVGVVRWFRDLYVIVTSVPLPWCPKDVAKLGRTNKRHLFPIYCRIDHKPLHLVPSLLRPGCRLRLSCTQITLLGKA